MMTIILTIFATCFIAVASLFFLRRKPVVQTVTTPSKSCLNPSAPIFVPMNIESIALAAEIEAELATLDDIFEEQLLANGIENEFNDEYDVIDSEDEEDEEEVNWTDVKTFDGKTLRVPREAAVFFNTSANPKFTPKSTPKNKSSIPCSFFIQGRCKKGTNCEYLHSSSK